MNLSSAPAPKSNNYGLWITVIVECLIIIAVGAYNIYEIRRHSQLLETKIQKLSEFSARQGEKVDRMTTALELHFGKRFNPAIPAMTNSLITEERVNQTIEFLEALKKKEGQE